MTVLSQNVQWVQAAKFAFISLGASAVALIVVYSIWFFDFHPEFQRFKQQERLESAVIKGSSFRRIYGDVVLEGGKTVIAGFSGGRAIVTTNLQFYADDFPFIKFNIEGLTRYSNAVVLWRRKDNPGRLFSLPLNRSGDDVTQVAMVYGGNQYSGVITEVGIAFFDGPEEGVSNNRNEEIRIDGVELRPFSAKVIARQILDDWTTPPVWPGYVNNVVRGAHGNAILLPNPTINLWVASSFLLLFLLLQLPSMPKSSRNMGGRASLIIVMIGFIVADSLRWHLRVELITDTSQRYAGLSLEERVKNNPTRCGRFPKDCGAEFLPYF